MGEATPTIFCWRCGHRLRLPRYSVVVGEDGHEHRVHNDCASGEYEERIVATHDPEYDDEDTDQTKWLRKRKEAGVAVGNHSSDVYPRREGAAVSERLRKGQRVRLRAEVIADYGHGNVEVWIGTRRMWVDFACVVPVKQRKRKEARRG